MSTRDNKQKKLALKSHLFVNTSLLYYFKNEK